MAQNPNHVAIIMDGNGRWASQLGQPRVFGHKVGSRVVREMVADCVTLGVRELTVFALSTENLSRPQEEVAHLLNLCVETIDQYLDELNSQGVCVRFIGDITSLGESVSKSVAYCEEETRNNQRLVLTIALNFSGRWHIIETTKKLIKSKDMHTDESIHQAFMSLLPSEPDVLIRTGGESRLSNFLLYHLAYTELFFMDIHWPDFKVSHLKSIIGTYQRRERRFGKLTGVTE